MRNGSTLYNGTPTTSAEAVITASGVTRLAQILAVNATGSAATITVNYVASGDSVGGVHSYPIAAAVSVPAGSVAELLGERLGSELGYIRLAPGDEIQAQQGTASALSLLAWGA